MVTGDARRLGSTMTTPTPWQNRRDRVLAACQGIELPRPLKDPAARLAGRACAMRMVVPFAQSVIVPRPTIEAAAAPCGATEVQALAGVVASDR